MVPHTTRRRYLSSLSLAGLAALAGCTDSADDGTATGPETETDDGSTPGTDGADDLGSPEAMVRESVEVRFEDPPATREYFHPIHPFHPDNLADEEAEELFTREFELDSVETETRDEEVSPERILTAPRLQLSEIEQETVADAIEGDRTAVVDVTATGTEGEERTFSAVTVTHDGEWVIIAQNIEPVDDSPDGESTPFETRLVDEISFDTEEHRARVRFVDSPVADSVTVETAAAESYRSTETPEALRYFDVYPDPGGDAVVVTATVDGEARVVHRERYPPSERIVDEVVYERAPEDSLREMRARVTFTGNRDAEEVFVESTVHGGELRLEPVENANYAFVGIDPSGDEIAVSLTIDDEERVVHRERYHPE